MKVTEHRRGRSFLATLTSALLVASGLALAPTAALAAPDAAEGTVADATLNWGVKESFRNYIGKGFAKGKITMLGGASVAADETYDWTGGVGTAAEDGSSADVRFRAADGVHFQGHNMPVNGVDQYVLDAAFLNPRVVVTSPTSGELRMDVRGYEFKSMTELGKPFTLDDAVVATLELSPSILNGNVRTWTNAAATLTQDGSIAFGGGAFYQPGDTLDPVTFSLPVTAPVAATETTTDLSVSATGVTVGDEVTLSATVSPAAAAGEVQFVASEKALGLPVAVEGGVAKLTTKDLQVGKQTITAVFTPADAKLYASSTSAAVDIDVAKPQREPVSVSVSKEAGLNPEGETVTVTGSGFLPNAPETNGVRPPLMGEFGGVYVSFGSFAEKWQPSAGAKGAARVGFDTKWAVPAADMLTIGGPEKGAIALNADGTFTTELKLSKNSAEALADGNYGVYTYSGSGASYAGFETYTPVAFGPAADTSVETSVSADSVLSGDQVTLTATVSKGVAGSVQFFNGDAEIGEPVEVAADKAVLKTNALEAVGKNEITAVFTPANADAYNVSTSAPVTVEVAERPVPKVTVSKTEGIDPAGETVTVTGSGFLPKAPESSGVRPPLMGKFGGVYVSFGSFAEKWQPSAGAKGAARVGFDTKWAVPAADMLTIGGPEKGAIALNADGTFTTELKLSKNSAEALADGNYGVYTYSGSGASYAGFETYTPVAFGPAADTSVETSVSADSVLSGDQVTLTATVSKGVAGSVQFFNGDAEIGEPVEVAADKAVLKTNALEAVGKNEITAVFTPANADAYNVSTSAPVTVEVAERPVPKVTVSKTEGIDPAGETVTVTGSGFLPKAPITNGKYDPFPGKFTGTYIVFGSFAENWQPSADVASSARKSFDTKWAVQAAELPTIAAMGGIELNADGTFETELKLSKDSATALADGNYGVYTYAAGGAKYAPFETYTPIEFAPAAATTVTIEASPTDVYVGDEVEVTASVSEGISGSVQFSNNGKALGKPVKVTDGNATLKTSALVTGENSITAHFVPDNGDLFAASSSDAAVVTAAAQPTIEINGKPAGETVRIVAGDTLLLKAGQFTADQEFSVEIHSKVVKLPGTFVADSDGFVTAEWVLPDGFEAGKHSIVLTAADTGRVFTFDDAFTVEKKAVIDGGNGNEGGKNPDGGTGPDSDKGKGAGSVDKGTSQKDAAKDTGAKGLAASGSNPATGMIALTGAMLLIGAALVVIRRRQMSSAE
ncbi:hypothetical protein ACI1US_00967 [Leucobacter sp. BZR 635]